MSITDRMLLSFFLFVFVVVVVFLMTFTIFSQRFLKGFSGPSLIFKQAEV